MREFFKTTVIAFLIAQVFRSFFFEPFHIPSGSMKSNLLVGDYLFVSKFSYGYSRYSFPLSIPFFKGRVPDGAPERGDVVVFRLPKNTKIDYIKRVIGLPGDQIHMKDGIVHINGKPLPQKQAGTWLDKEGNKVTSLKQYLESMPNGKEYIVLDETPNNPVDSTAVYFVPKGHYFMMGDNRDNSTDSRFLSEVGFVPHENLIGRAEWIVFSLDLDDPWWQFWQWPSALRLDRFFRTIH